MYWSNNFGDSLIELPQYFDEVYHLAADTVLGLIQRVGPYKSTEVFAHDIYRSVDGGFTWTLVHEMHGLEIHFYFPQFLTDSAGNVYLGNRENTLVRSRDRGATWSDLNIPGGGGNFNYFYLWASSAGDLYISNNTIIYRSKDFGETWQNYHQGLPTGGNFSLTLGICTPTGKIIAGVSSFGLYQRYINDEYTSTAYHGNHPLRVYPNPSDTFITIETEMFNPANPEVLYLHDLNGKAVMNVPVNSYTTKMNVDGLKPGIYLLRRDAEAVKVVIMR